MHKVGKLLLYVIIFEGILLGSGRIIEISALSLRIILFMTAILYTLVLLIPRGIKERYFTLTIIYVGLCLLLPTLIGSVNGGKTDLIIEDIKPLSYFIIILFISNFITRKKIIVEISRIIKVSSLFLLIAYFLLLLLTQIRVITFMDLYSLLFDSGEILFRGKEGFFFYKGFIYLCVGFVFYFAENNIMSKLTAALFFVGIILTFTRGFLYSTLIVMCFYYIYRVFQKKNKFPMKLLFLSIILIVIGFQFFEFFLENFGSKADSDSVRWLIIDQVVNSINPISMFIGHGFGIGVSVRPVHMEISFLEIFHKQGIIGIAWWLFIIIAMFINYQKSCNNGYYNLATPYFFSSLLVYFQSFTNPFINNPIGMLIIVISFSCLDVLSTRTCK